MNVAIISNFNGIGLQRDAELLTAFLQERGHQVTGYQYDVNPETLPLHDLTIFLEVVPRQYLGIAKIHWWFANPEFVRPQVIEVAQRTFHKVFAKTHEAQRLLEPYFPGITHYTGFLARDQHDGGAIRERRILHIGGNSILRGTQTVLDTWKWRKNGKALNVPLSIVSNTLGDQEIPKNVTVLKQVDDAELKHLQNSHLFHVYPSGTEGYGHALHESLSVGALILTTDAPPMNEIHSAYKISWCAKSSIGLADVYEVSALTLHQAIQELLTLRPPYSFLPREEFLRNNEEFKTLFGEHLEELTTIPWVGDRWEAPALLKSAKRRNGKTIAFIGNFAAQESTENMVRWALEERLGHEVIMLQENELRASELKMIAQYGSDMLLWVRTPGWLRIPDQEILEILEGLRARQIPSVSLHLDKFWGIPDREPLIGVHPFWRTDFVCTADGSRDKDFAARGVNHYFMRPAASEVFAHRGRPRREWRCNVAFVGARTYHKEHPWREELISFLERTYGSDFKLIEGGVRGHDLNDFYASARVVVGDCFGSGKIPCYWSDRMVETPMRYGFLLSPNIEGFDIPLATFEPENLVDLHEKIEYWLGHEKERQELLTGCALHVQKHDTWTKRMQWVLDGVTEGLVLDDRESFATPD